MASYRDMATRLDDDLEDFLVGPRQQTKRPGAPVDPGRLWLSVRRDLRWIPLGGAIWAVLGLAIALLFIKHTYKSEAVLVWEPKPEAGHVEERQLATEAGSLKLPG